MAKLEIEYSGVRLFHETWQRPGTQGSLILDERSRSDVSVKIMICNKAGCSSLITYKCDFYKSTGNNPLGMFVFFSFHYTFLLVCYCFSLLVFVSLTCRVKLSLHSWFLCRISFVPTV